MVVNCGPRLDLYIFTKNSMSMIWCPMYQIKVGLGKHSNGFFLNILHGSNKNFRRENKHFSMKSAHETKQTQDTRENLISRLYVGTYILYNQCSGYTYEEIVVGLIQGY